MTKGKTATRRLAVLAASVGLMAGAATGTAHADPAVDFSAAPAVDFSWATIATESDNLVHYQQVANQAMSGDNISCRVEKPVFVSQPEVDSRVTVKGEDDAVSAVECVDLFLQAQDLISGEMYIEWLPENADPNIGWFLEDGTRTPVGGRMIRGVGAQPVVLSHIYEANHPSQGRPHRACIRLDAPKSFAPLCTTFLSTSVNTSI